MQIQGLAGIVVMMGLAWLMSEHRSRIDFTILVKGVLLQVAIAFCCLVLPGFTQALDFAAMLINTILQQADVGIGFVFGAELASGEGPVGLVLAIQVTGVLIFFSALMSILYYLNVMPPIIALMAHGLRRTLGLTGTEAVALSANVFVGITEAPLCILPYLEKLTRAQMALLMTGGFATIAGTVLGLYVSFLGGVGEANNESRLFFLTHLLTASVMSAPAAFVIARILVPETKEPFDVGVKSEQIDSRAENLFDAAALGASDGMKLSLNIIAMLMAFVSLMALVNWPLEWLSRLAPVQTVLGGIGLESLRIEAVLGWLLTPLAWCMGVTWSDSTFVGTLLGQKLILTEFVAYQNLGQSLQTGAVTLSDPRSAQIAAYALCGFANVATIAIQIGGLTVVAPGQRSIIVSLSLKTMLGGALASFMTAAVASLFL